MATYTSYLNLKKPEGGERYALADFNDNMQKIDDFARNVTGAVITNEYSTVLSAINAFRTSKTFPFTIQKYGSSACSDLPSGLNSTCEWSVICYGNAQRMTVELTVFTGGSSKNKFKYTANLYNGDYLYGWSTLDDKVFPTGMAETISTATDFNTLLDLKNYVLSSNSVATGSANCPSSNAGKLCTWTIDGGSFDRAWAYGGQIYIDIPGREFRRQITTNGSKVLNFGAWQQLALNSHLANLLRVTDAVGTVSNLAPHGAVSVPLSLSIPEGYRLYMYGPLRTSGFVGGGYMLNNTTAWVFNPTDNAVSGTIIIGVLCIKNL